VVSCRVPRLVGAALLAAALAPVWAAAEAPPLTLPAAIPPAERTQLLDLVRSASVSASARSEPFVARADVFEFLLDHPEFATHVTRALRLARYRIWHDPEGLWLDDGWGAVGRFRVVHAANGSRVMYARGQYEPKLLPSIHGQAVVVLEYGTQPAANGRALITTHVAGFLKLDSRLLELAGRLAGPLARAKAEKEAERLVRVFVRVSRAIEDDAAGVHARVREREGVPQRDLEEFRRLLDLR